MSREVDASNYYSNNTDMDDFSTAEEQLMRHVSTKSQSGSTKSKEKNGLVAKVMDEVSEEAITGDFDEYGINSKCLGRTESQGKIRIKRKDES